MKTLAIPKNLFSLLMNTIEEGSPIEEYSPTNPVPALIVGSLSMANFLQKPGQPGNVLLTGHLQTRQKNPVADLSASGQLVFYVSL